MKRVSLLVLFAIVVSMPMSATWLYTKMSSVTNHIATQHNHPKPNKHHPENVRSNVQSIASISKNEMNNLEEQLVSTSLKGTLPPNTFDLLNGEVIKNESLLSIFEYFLALDGELSLEQIKQLLSLYANNHLSNLQVSQVIAAFDQYYDFLQHMSESQPLLDEQEDLASKLAWIKQQRRAHFGDIQAEQYFGYEESYDDYQLAKLDIANNHQLSAQEKAKAIADLTSDLPEDLKQRSFERLYTKQQIKIERDITSTLSDSDKYNARLAAFGAEATERLTALDQQRAIWHERLENYRFEAEDIYESGLSRKDQEAAIAALRDRHFESHEIPRVATLDQFH